MACDPAAIQAKIDIVEQQICDLQDALVSQAIATADGTTTDEGGRTFSLKGPKGGSVDFDEGDKSKGGGASAASSSKLLCKLEDNLHRLRKDLARCKRGGKAISPRLGGIDTIRRRGQGCNEC